MTAEQIAWSVVTSLLATAIWWAIGRRIRARNPKPPGATAAPAETQMSPLEQAILDRLSKDPYHHPSRSSLLREFPAVDPSALNRALKSLDLAGRVFIDPHDRIRLGEDMTI